MVVVVRHLFAAIDRRSSEIRKALLLFGMIVVAFPIPIARLTSGLDPSWMAALNWASATGWVFGRDGIFTYGPLGFTLFPVDCASAQWRSVALVGQLCLYGLWWLNAGLVLANIRDWEGQLLFFVGAVAALLKPDGGAVITMTAIGLLAVSQRRNSLALALLAAVVSGCSLFIKFNLGVSCCASVLTWCLLRAVCDPWRVAVGKGVAVCGALVASAVAVNWACGGAWADLVRFIDYSIRMSADYSSQMSLSGPPGLVVYLLAVLAFLSAYAVSGVFLKTTGWSTAALLVLPAFFEYKRAVTRMDFEHWLPGMLGMAGVVGHLVVANAGARERLVIRWCVGVIILAGFILIRYTGVVDLAVVVGIVLGAMTLRSCRFLPDQPWGMHLRVWFAGLALTSMLAVCVLLAACATLPAYPSSPDLPPGFVNLLKLANLKSWLAKPPTPHIEIPARMREMIGTESVDGYQSEIATILMYQLNYRPRFIFQSNMAYNPILDSAVAEQIASHDSPRFILYTHNSSIDSAHPWMVDPLTWREIYRWYDLVDEASDLLLLRRRTSPRWRNSLPPSKEFQIEFGETLAIPDGAPAHRLLRARVEMTPFGKLLRFLFRVVPPTIRVEYVDGRVVEHRLVWLNAASGFLISDLPYDSAANASFFRGTGGTGVRSVTFLGDRRYFSRAIHVSWEDLPVQASPRTPQP